MPILRHEGTAGLLPWWLGASRSRRHPWEIRLMPLGREQLAARGGFRWGVTAEGSRQIGAINHGLTRMQELLQGLFARTASPFLPWGGGKLSAPCLGGSEASHQPMVNINPPTPILSILSFCPPPFFNPISESGVSFYEGPAEAVGPGRKEPW